MSFGNTQDNACSAFVLWGPVLTVLGVCFGAVAVWRKRKQIRVSGWFAIVAALAGIVTAASFMLQDMIHRNVNMATLGQFDVLMVTILPILSGAICAGVIWLLNTPFEGAT
jgi:hypothetical protein